MRVNDQYSIRRLDQYNFGLIKHGIKGEDSKNAGQETESTISYFSTIENACNKIVSLQIDTEDIHSILESIKTSTQEIKKALKENK